MARGRSGTAPDPDWVLLYRAGLSGKKIAELTGAPPSTVSYHLAAAKATDPGLKAAHAAAGKSPNHASQPGLKRMNQVIAVVQATGRYPSPSADAAWEQKLAAWLRRRRRDANAGILGPAVAAGLAVLPDWRHRSFPLLLLATMDSQSRHKCGQCPHPLWQDKPCTRSSHERLRGASKRNPVPKSATSCRTRRSRP